MNGPRARYAVKRGGIVPVAYVVVAYGLWAFRPSEPPDWLATFVLPLVVGPLYALLVYFEVGPVQTEVQR